MARSGESGTGFLRKGASKLRSTCANELDREEGMERGRGGRGNY